MQPENIIELLLFCVCFFLHHLLNWIIETCLEGQRVRFLRAIRKHGDKKKFQVKLSLSLPGDNPSKVFVPVCFMVTSLS